MPTPRSRRAPARRAEALGRLGRRLRRLDPRQFLARLQRQDRLRRHAPELHRFLDSPPFPPVVGGFSVRGQNYSVGGTLSYRIDLGTSGWYIEPTAGLDYTRSTYKDGGRFGLSNGSTLRGRAGATVGTTIILSDTLALQPSFGLFAFSNLSVKSDGGPPLAIDLNSLQPATQTDEGKIYGEVQGGFNLVGAGGLSFNTRAEYRFGEGVRGGAIRAGFRYQF